MRRRPGSDRTRAATGEWRQVGIRPASPEHAHPVRPGCLGQQPFHETRLTPTGCPRRGRRTACPPPRHGERIAPGCRERHHDRPMHGSRVNELARALARREDEVVLVEPRAVDPALGPVADPGDRHHATTDAPDVERVEQGDHDVDRGIELVPLIPQALHVGDPPAEPRERVTQLMRGVVVAIPRRRSLRVTVMATCGGSSDHWPPRGGDREGRSGTPGTEAVDEQLAVPRPVSPLPLLALGVLCPELVVPQHREAVVDEEAPIRPQLDVEVDVLGAVQVARRESADRLERRALDQEARGRQGGRLTNAPRVLPQRVLADAQVAADRDAIGTDELDPAVLQREVRRPPVTLRGPSRRRG